MASTGFPYVPCQSGSPVRVQDEAVILTRWPQRPVPRLLDFGARLHVREVCRMCFRGRYVTKVNKDSAPSRRAGERMGIRLI